MTTELIYLGKVAGVTFEPAKSGLQEVVRYVAENQISGVIPADLRHNPANKYDHEAIEVYARLSRRDSVFVGHVPKPYNSKILKLGIGAVQARLDRLNFHEDRVAGLTLEITCEATSARPVRVNPDAVPAGSSREQLNRLLMNLYRPYLAKFPETRFAELLRGR